MTGSFYVRRLGVERRKVFREKFVEIYDKYEAKAKEVNEDSMLIYNIEGKFAIFFARLPSSVQFDQSDVVYSDMEYQSMLIEEALMKANKKKPGKHNIR